LTVADRIAATLAELGIRRAYGLPGEDHMTLLDAFAGAGVEYRAAYNESSAVIMAATDAAITGQPGVVVLSLAPGVSNGMNGLVHAHLEGLPVLVFSGAHPSARRPFVIRQGFDTEELVRPTTKWTARLAEGADPAALVCKAVDIAMTGRRGPVYLEVPDDVVSAEESFPDNGSVELLRRTPTATLTPDPAAVTRLATRLSSATRPVLVVGGRAADVSRDVLARFAATVRCPVLLTSGQQGALAPDHPYLAGTFLNGNLEATLLERSDLILMVNPEGFDHYNRAWGYKTTPIAITSAPDTEWLYTFDERILADPETLLTGLTSGGASEWTEQDVTDYRAGIRAALLQHTGDQLSAVEAVDTALAAAPAEVRVVADAGFSKPLVALLAKISERGRYLASNALSTMGFSVPAASAAAHAQAVPVLAFLGDGSLLMRAAEVALARDAQAPVVFLAVMDRSLSQIQIKQERKKLRDVGVQLPEVDCQKLAESVGIRGVDVHSVAELRAALDGAWEQDSPLLIGAHVDGALSRPLFEVLRG
jgi:acetolactate synthase I/II/III large subunit